ncbi:hypothetical protein [Bradyrhizobium valentinum]|uniref:Uncharacterized protein n=1 Tax=Bradyrhizobium valentinum TaxID=1518501 RepID=A0A0R3KVD0_9BRAD|nr:hypothetical protein [Bradyrhizobium valentinum]KRQ99242.1 hypothetical protein CP49_11630 [Bradyrhizobium valentinum]
MIARRALLQALACAIAAPALAAANEGESFSALWDRRIVLRENVAPPPVTAAAETAVVTEVRPKRRHRKHFRRRRYARRYRRRRT